MAITDEEWVKLGKMMRDNNAEVLEDVIFPKLVEIQNEIKGVEIRLDKKIGKVEKTLTDKINHVEISLRSSMDHLAKTVTETKTNHERRIKRLEDGVGIFAD